MMAAEAQERGFYQAKKRAHKAAMRAAETGEFDAVICIGCVIKGETMHFEYIASATCQGISEAALATGVPIALGVLTTGYVFTATIAAAGALLVVGGLMLQAHAGLYAPWLPSLVAGIATATFAHARRVATRLAHERGKNVRSEREKAKLGAIVRTAQMFAHDVRKPFSMLECACDVA